MRSVPVIALAVAAAWQTVPSHARDTRRLQPASNWVLDYAEESCRLARHFGDGKNRVTLIMDQFAPGDSFKLIFAGDSVKPRTRIRPMKATLRFGPNEPEVAITGLEGKSGTQRLFIVEGVVRLAPLTDVETSSRNEAWKQGAPFEAEPIGEGRERAAAWLELRDVLRFDLVLETGRMDKPLAALRACSWDAVRSWGLDVEQQKSLTRKPLPKEGGADWFNPNDYPQDMLRPASEAIVHIRLMVDESGAPTSCHIQESTRPKDFDDVVCRVLMKRAKFDPALDVHGRPVKSVAYLTFNSRIR